MKNSRAFTPAAPDSLEDRSVPSGFGGIHVSHAFVIPHTFAASNAITVPVQFPPGTFFQGGNPGIVTATNGERLSLNHR